MTMSIHQANIEDVEEILFVINKSNSEAYKKIIPPEYFREPVLTLDELLKEFEEITFYTYRGFRSLGVIIPPKHNQMV